MTDRYGYPAHRQAAQRPRSPLTEEDFALSMKVSQRARSDEDNDDLRGLLVHRLSNNTKAIARIGLRNQKIAIFCEGCDTWTPVEEFPLEFDCACGLSFATEFVVMERLEDDED